MDVFTTTDQLGISVEIPFPPQRIVSLVPSQTELLYSLDLDSQVVGITRYCIRPAHWQSEKAIIGGTKNFDFEKIAALNPDLIIGNKEENYQVGIEHLNQRFPVWMSDIVTLEDSLDMIKRVGLICDREQAGFDMATRIAESFSSVKPVECRNALYLIWRKPWMAAGTGTFINEMLRFNGLTNLAVGRYPELTSDDLRRLNPEVVLLSSEPYPFQEKHIQEITAILPQSKALLVDGEMFSWYGSRLLHSPGYFGTLSF